jgi:hypothetical protein
MPRGARIAPGEIVYQALTRANGRNELFHKPEDYSAFERIIIWPLDAPADCIDWLNGAQTAGERHALRKSVNRGTPLAQNIGRWDRQYAAVGICYSFHAVDLEEKSIESHQIRKGLRPLFSPPYCYQAIRLRRSGTSLIILRVTLRITTAIHLDTDKRSEPYAIPVG